MCKDQVCKLKNILLKIRNDIRRGYKYFHYKLESSGIFLEMAHLLLCLLMTRFLCLGQVCVGGFLSLL